MNHWNYTQMLRKKPSIDQKEKENLAEFFRSKPDYSDLPHDLQETIGDSS
jgi:uncharacterized membrane protein YgaE (UPF0421/DUF939 family)